MSATAKLLKDLGWEVSGSDSGFYPPASDYLAKHKIPFKKGYQKEHLPKDTELIVIGKNAKLVPKENKEVAAAFESGISVRSFPEVLEGLLATSHNIVVAGSYAKSTCTALLAWCLEHAGKKPGYFIGAAPLNDMDMVALGDRKLFVIEGDEYPSSNWDPTSKFLYYHPRDVLLTSASHDHVNIFPTHKKYLEPFKALLSLMPADGLLVANTDDDSARMLAHAHTRTTVLYGLNKSKKVFDISNTFWSARSMESGQTGKFELMRNDKAIIQLETTLLGKHNIQNIVGVSAMLLEKELVTPQELQKGIPSFKGVKRRLDLLSPSSRVPVFEGFGSSYEKARAGFDAIRLHFPKKRLITVFEPHTFSWRNRDALPWYDTVFRDSDLVLIYEPAAQGAETHKQLSQQEIVKRVQEAGVDARPIHSEQEGLTLLEKELGERDAVLLMTSGDLGGLIKSVPKLAEDHFPKK